MINIEYYDDAFAKSNLMYWDGIDANTLNEINGWLFLMGIYDMREEPMFEPVDYAIRLNMDLLPRNSQTYVSPGNMAISQYIGNQVNEGDRVLVTNQADSKSNGIYTITKAGSLSEPFVLTRALDANTLLLMAPGKRVVCKSGSWENNVFQLMGYESDSTVFEEQHFDFINMSDFGFYANESWGIRVLDTINCSNLIESEDDLYKFIKPDCINADSKRIIRLIVKHDAFSMINLNELLKAVLKRKFSFSSSVYECKCIFGK